MLELIAKDHLNGHAPVIMAIFGNVPIMSKKGGNILKIQVIFGRKKTFPYSARPPGCDYNIINVLSQIFQIPFLYFRAWG